jgi:acyl-CoA reductase-like NAD-dependent aldehyde dehydrogenase
LQEPYPANFQESLFHKEKGLEVNMDFEGNFVQIINGQIAVTEKTRHGINPATLEAKKEVPVATPDDLDRAVKAGKAALKAWSRMPYEKRRHAVLMYADAIETSKIQFRDLLVSEQGKPVSPNDPHIE